MKSLQLMFVHILHSLKFHMERNHWNSDKFYYLMVTLLFYVTFLLATDSEAVQRHHGRIPPCMVPLLRFGHILMKPLHLLITNVSRFSTGGGGGGKFRV